MVKTPSLARASRGSTSYYSDGARLGMSSPWPEKALRQGKVLHPTKRLIRPDCSHPVQTYHGILAETWRGTVEIRIPEQGVEEREKGNGDAYSEDCICQVSTIDTLRHMP